MNRRLHNLLGALGTAVYDAQARPIVEGGLSVSEGTALNRIGQAPGCSIAWVRTGLGITHPGAVRVVDAMVRSGLVERGPGADGRTVALHLTEHGQQAFEQQVSSRRVALEQALAGIPKAELASFEKAICTVLAALTRGPDQAEHLCRLCDERFCPQDVCPVTTAAAEGRPER